METLSQLQRYINMELLILQGIWKDLYLKYWYLLNIQLLKNTSYPELALQVIFPQSEKWEDLENLYIYFKSIKTGKGILDKIENTFKKTICRSEKSRRLIAGIESDKASHKTDHDI